MQITYMKIRNNILLSSYAILSIHLCKRATSSPVHHGEKSMAASRSQIFCGTGSLLEDDNTNFLLHIYRDLPDVLWLYLITSYGLQGLPHTYLGVLRARFATLNNKIRLQI